MATRRKIAQANVSAKPRPAAKVSKRAAERAEYEALLASVDRRLAEADAQIDAVLLRMERWDRHGVGR